MFFKRWKKRKRNIQDIEDEAQNKYAAMEEEPATVRHMVIELCEQMIDVSREMEDAKSEYQLVTSYLNDIQTIEDLPDIKRNPITDIAKKIHKNSDIRNEFLKTEQKLSDVQFSQMQEEDDEIPKVVKRLKSNETYLDAITKDMHFLEGEKLEWTMLRQEMQGEQRILRKLAYIGLALFATIAILLLLLAVVLEMETQLYMVLLAFFATLFGGYILLRYQSCNKELKRCDINQNRAITLENRVKIKYVNIKNAVDYVCEKYHVKNSYELTYIYEQYQQMLKDQEKFRKTNEELELYNEQLIRILESYRLYDARVWINYTNALIEPKEMVELKHNLIARRQKLRNRIEYNSSTISDLRKKIGNYVRNMKDGAKQIEQILAKLEEINH